MINLDDLKNNTFLGIVEDNVDPKKMGRCRIRVFNVFDTIPLEDIPWASPFKDLNGNGANIPERGKILTVVFDSGNIYTPEYIYAQHYNVNLKRKLEELTESDYVSFKSLVFDHKTQIYVNDSEGLKIDHKFNNMNITEGGIDLNLKDNNGLVNIGDATAGQQAILGNHWMEWFDEFVENLLGVNSGPYLGNLGAPVVPNPAFIAVLQKYKAIKDPILLSHHVNIVDNNMVSTVRMTNRQNDAQVGDEWRSTVMKNEITVRQIEEFKPKPGKKPDYDDTYTAPTTDGNPDAEGSNKPPANDPLSSQTSNEKVDKLIRYMKSKNYNVYDKNNVLNIVGMRKKDDGVVTNKFDDEINVFFKNASGQWELMQYTITTTPGFIPKTKSLPSNVAILTPGQYVDQYKLGFHQSKPDHKCLKYATSVVNRNDTPSKYNYSAITSKGSFGINIHRSNPAGSSENVFNWSEGCQVFKNINQFKQFIKLCEDQESLGGKKTFTYTLCKKSDFDNFT